MSIYQVLFSAKTSEYFVANSAGTLFCPDNGEALQEVVGMFFIWRQCNVVEKFGGSTKHFVLHLLNTEHTVLYASIDYF